jgi:hypothetical protein
LSAFVNATPAAVADYLMPTFVYAAEQIPIHYISTTRVLYQATAGMRLLTEAQQNAVYDAMYEGLTSHPNFRFALTRHDIATLSGDLEGYYGALAANYLHGTINTQLELIPSTLSSAPDDDDDDSQNNNQKKEVAVVGALDMGGSSTQIVFLPQHHHQQLVEHMTKYTTSTSPPTDDEYYDDDSVCRNSNNDASASTTTPAATSPDMESTTVPLVEECHVASRDEYPRVLQGEDFFAVSYLSYGADQFRERLWTTWITEWQALNGTPETCDAHVIPNPCAFKGYEAEWQGYKLVGTGDAHKCVQEVQRHIPHPEQTLEELNHLDEITMPEQMVGGISHPPVHGKFVAMSLYFFTLDTLRALSHPDKEAYEALNLSWPNPSIEELYNALDGLCSRQWQGDLEDIQHDAHPYTKAETLPHRCMEAVYIVTLLRDGFGFAPESRDITFTFLVDGSEVEWTLGMALAMRSEERSKPSSIPQQSLLDVQTSRTRTTEHPSSEPSTATTVNLTYNRSPTPTSCAEDFVEDFRKEIICHTTAS